MNDKIDYLNINRESWNELVPSHLQSEFYNVNGFLAGDCTLTEIELALLGDVKGKRILHLQCHFGLDTLSLARMGAIVTGVDLSESAIKAANDLAHKSGLEARFIVSDIYALDLKEQFDIVFTSYGVIGWLPDIDKWATVVSAHLKPNGIFVMAEFHPVLWMYDNDFTKVEYSYFNSDAILEEEDGSYVDGSERIKRKTVTWNHGLGEVINSLFKANIELLDFKEYNYSTQNCFKEMEEIEKGRFQLKKFGGKLPMVYSVRGRRK